MICKKYIKSVFVISTMIWGSVCFAQSKSSNNSSPTTLSIKQLIDSLNITKDQKYFDLSLIYLNAKARPLDSLTNKLLNSVITLFNENTSEKKVLISLQKAPLSEFDFYVSEKFFIPSNEQPDTSIYSEMIKAAKILRGKFIEERVYNYLQKDSSIRKSIISERVFGDFWDILVHTDPIKYTNRCMVFYWNDPLGFKFLESDRYSQRIASDVISFSSKLNQYSICFLKMIQPGYFKNQKNQSDLKHKQLVGQILQNIPPNYTPVNISVRLAFYKCLNEKERISLKSKLRDAFFKSAWLYPDFLLSDTSLLNIMGISSVQKNQFPVILNQKKYHLLKKYIEPDSSFYIQRNFKTRWLSKTQLAFPFIPRKVPRDYLIAKDISNNTAKDYDISDQFKSEYFPMPDQDWDFHRRFVGFHVIDYSSTFDLGMRLSDYMRKDSIYENYDAQAGLMINNKLINIAYNLHFLLHSGIKFKGPRLDSGTFISDIYRQIKVCLPSLKVHTVATAETSHLLDSQDVNLQFQNFYNFNPNLKYILFARSVDLSSEKYIETIKVLSKDHQIKIFKYIGTIPLNFLYPLSQNINIFDVSNYSFAVRELKNANLRYFRNIDDEFDRIAMFPGDYIEAALGAMSESIWEPQAAEDLYSADHDFSNFKLWETETQRNIKYIVNTYKVPESEYVPAILIGDNSEHDPTKLSKLHYLTHANNADFDTFEKSFSDAIGNAIKYYGSTIIFAPQAWGQIQRLPKTEGCKFPDVLCYTGLLTNPNKGRQGGIAQLNKINADFDQNFYNYSDWMIVGMNNCEMTPKTNTTTCARIIFDGNYENALTIYGISSNKWSTDANCWNFSYSFIHTKFSLPANVKIAIQKYPALFHHRWRRSEMKFPHLIFQLDPSGLYKHSYEQLTTLSNNLVNETYGCFNSLYYFQKNGLLPFANKIFLFPTDTDHSELIKPIKALYKTNCGFWFNRQLSTVDKIFRTVRSDENFIADTINQDLYDKLVMKSAFQDVSKKITEAVARIKSSIDNQKDDFTIFIGVSTNGNISFQINGLTYNTSYASPEFTQPSIPMSDNNYKGFQR